MSDTSHLGGTALVGDPMTWMPDVWEYLIKKYDFNSMLDIGCGVGKNARWFHERGIVARGVEGFPDYLRHTVLPEGFVFPHDYTIGAFVPPEKYDLGWSSEFVEHVEEQFVPNFMATFKQCRFVCMTHATPGQGGYHHVNEQPSEYWISQMNNAGFEHLAEDSAWMQATGPNTHYGRRTLMLFKNLNP